MSHYSGKAKYSLNSLSKFHLESPSTWNLMGTLTCKSFNRPSFKVVTQMLYRPVRDSDVGGNWGQKKAMIIKWKMIIGIMVLIIPMRLICMRSINYCQPSCALLKMWVSISAFRLCIITELKLLLIFFLGRKLLLIVDSFIISYISWAKCDCGLPRTILVKLFLLLFGLLALVCTQNLKLKDYELSFVKILIRSLN